MIGRTGGIEVKQLAVHDRRNFTTVTIDMSYGLGEYRSEPPSRISEYLQGCGPATLRWRRISRGSYASATPP